MESKEIVKALGLCFNINHNAGLNCCECSYRSSNKCSLDLYNDTIELINRQQEEIDKLKNDIFCIANERDAWKDTVNTTATEAIKEFAEELKKYSVEIALGEKYKYKVVTLQGIDSIAERMVGTENG